MAGGSELRIDPERLLADLEALAAIGRHPAGGIHRAAFSPAYREAAEWLQDRMRAAGLETRVDAAGNVIGRMGPPEGAVVMTGSHIDSVRRGGSLDGTLGVLGGVEVARVLRENAVPLEAPFEVVAFNDEEGAYLSLLGAMALSGTLRTEDLENAVDIDGAGLGDALRENGMDPARMHEAAYPAGSIRKYIELHIEQGPVLENLGVAIGVVDGIVCQRNVDYTFFGQSNHAGTTPMDMRRDAFRGAAEFVSRCYGLLDGPGVASPSTRMTFGTCRIEPGSSNVIPARATVRLDARDLDDANSERLVQRVGATAREVARKYALELGIQDLCTNPAAMMAPDLVQAIAASADALGYSYRVMPSGAGHDAQAIALVADAGMIFVPSRGGLSHHPGEWTEPAALERGANVLLLTLLGELLGPGAAAQR